MNFRGMQTFRPQHIFKDSLRKRKSHSAHNVIKGLQAASLERDGLIIIARIQAISEGSYSRNKEERFKRYIEELIIRPQVNL